MNPACGCVQILGRGLDEDELVDPELGQGSDVVRLAAVEPRSPPAADGPTVGRDAPLASGHLRGSRLVTDGRRLGGILGQPRR